MTVRARFSAELDAVERKLQEAIAAKRGQRVTEWQASQAYVPAAGANVPTLLPFDELEALMEALMARVLPQNTADADAAGDGAEFE
jgi:hypothetical protein